MATNIIIYRRTHFPDRRLSNRSAPVVWPTVRSPPTPDRRCRVTHPKGPRIRVLDRFLSNRCRRRSMQRRRGHGRTGYRRYHVTFNDRRTTVTLDRHLSAWLTLKLGASHLPDPDGAEDAASHRAVREWLQGLLDVVGKPAGESLSCWLQARALEAVVDPELKSRVHQW